MARSIANYQKVQAKTATPGQRVVMVYEGIVKNLRLALDAFGDDSPTRMETIHNAIQLSEKLIVELKLALDKENGGEIAESLESLYDFWLEHLSQGNVNKEPKYIREVFTMVKDLTESWRQAVRKAK